MGDVVSLTKDPIAKGETATAEVVQFLRKYADSIESGERRPVHKAILLMYEDIGEQFRVSTAYCNASTVERAGMLTLSLHDTASTTERE